MSKNQIASEMNVLQNLCKKTPALEHLNLMTNPCNPVFTNQLKYSEFRARLSIWIPSLKTLDGTDFQDDAENIQKLKDSEGRKRKEFLERGTLAPIPEKKGAAITNKNLKAAAGTTAFEYN